MWLAEAKSGVFVLAALALAGGIARGQACPPTVVALAPATVGVTYAQLLYAVGGQPPYSAFLLAGSLPPGIAMSVDANGVVTLAGVASTDTGSPFVFNITFLDQTGVRSNPCTFSIVVVGSSAAPSLTVVPGGQPGLPVGALKFAGLAKSSATMQQSLLLTNPGGGSVTFSVAASPGAPWILSVSPSSGTITSTTPQVVTVTVSAQNLSAGAVLGAVQITSSAGNLNVPVSMFVTNTGPILGVGLSGIRFNMVQGAGSAVTQSVNITDEGDPTSTVNWTASTASLPGVPNGNFLTFGMQNGQSTPGDPVGLPFSLSPSASSLAAGAYYQLIQLSDNNAQNSPQYITAVLNVVPTTSVTVPEPTPAGLVFSGRPGQNLGSQQLTAYLSSQTLSPFTASASIPPGQNWLHVTPTNSSASTSSPSVVTVTVTTAGLPAGVYTGQINLTFPGILVSNNPLVFFENVTLILGSPNGGSELRKGVHADTGVSGCAPSQLVLTETGIPGNFLMPAGWPTNLVATLTDDCGNTVGGASVNASFSNGDPPLTLEDQNQGGQYAVTWQPTNLNTVAITLNANAAPLKPAFTQLTGGIYKNVAPVLNPNGIVNNLNGQIGGALSPGTVAQAHGTGLASQTAQPPTVPLPTAYNSTQLVVGGRLAPLYYLSDKQLNVQIPAELSAGQQVATVAIVNGQLTLPQSVGLVPIMPGVAAFDDGTLIAQHSADYTLVTASSPAHPGETLIMYLVGMGPTNPKVASGAAAPGNNPGDPLAQVTVQPTVAVDGQNAFVAFAGLTPGGVGLYQIDFTVPPNARAGSLNVTVSQGAVSANTTTLPVTTP